SQATAKKEICQWRKWVFTTCRRVVTKSCLIKNLKFSCDFLTISATTIPQQLINVNLIIQLNMSIDIKILQSACCGPDKPIKEEIKAAASNIDADVNIEQPTELDEIMKHGTMTFPSIVVDGKVYDYAKFSSQKDLQDLLEKSISLTK